MTGTKRADEEAFRRCAAPLSLGHWFGRLLWAFTLLIIACTIDRSVATLSIALTEREPGWLQDLRHSAQHFGEFIGIAFVLVTLWLLDPMRRRPIVLTMACVLLAGGIAAGLKLLPGRVRPNVSDGQTVWNGPVRPGEMKPDPSFPSGHTTAAFAFAMCLSTMYPNGRRVFVLLAILCGVSRILSGRHFVTDTIAGAWIGWEVARLMWDSHIGGLVTFLDRLLPPSSWYPGWKWDRMEPAAATASKFETEENSNTERRERDPVHSLV